MCVCVCVFTLSNVNVDLSTDWKYIIFFVFWFFVDFFSSPAPRSLWILQPGIEPRPSAVKVPSPDGWTTREFPGFFFFLKTKKLA